MHARRTVNGKRRTVNGLRALTLALALALTPDTSPMGGHLSHAGSNPN